MPQMSPLLVEWCSEYDALGDPLMLDSVLDAILAAASPVPAAPPLAR